MSKMVIKVARLLPRTSTVFSATITSSLVSRIWFKRWNLILQKKLSWEKDLTWKDLMLTWNKLKGRKSSTVVSLSRRTIIRKYIYLNNMVFSNFSLNFYKINNLINDSKTGISDKKDMSTSGLVEIVVKR